MTRNRLSKVRRLALAVVLGNLALVGLLGSVLPPAALVLLPVIAFTVPLLSAATIEEALKARPSDRQNNTAARATAPRLTGALPHAC